MHEPDDGTTLTPALLRMWMTEYPLAGLGVAHGPELVGIDVDLDELTAEVLSVLPPTPCVKVGAKGLTLFYSNPHDLRSEDFSRGGARILQILGTGRQSAIPPSVHPGIQRPYRWLAPWGGQPTAMWDCPAGSLPPLERIHRHALERLAVRHGARDPFLAYAEREARLREGTVGDAATAADIEARRARYEVYARAAVRRAAEELAGTGKGGRNAELFKTAASLSRFVAAGVLEADKVVAPLLWACGENGLLAEDGEYACGRSIKSGLDAGKTAPLTAIESDEVRAVRAFEGHPAPPLPEGASAEPVVEAVPEGLENFLALLPENKVIYVPTRSLWPPESLDKSMPRIETGRLAPSDSGGTKPATMRPSVWLALHKPIKQLIWHPSEPQIVRDKLLLDGGWLEQPGDVVFNTYVPPAVRPGRADGAGRWLEHIRLVYPADADHLLTWMAFKVQYPGEKVNHAIVLAGASGIGKDTLLRPLIWAVGPWNVREASPREIVGSQNNGYLQCVILRVSEVRDLGEASRFAFFEQMKTIEAAPPEVHSVVDKWVKAHPVANVCGVIYTSNHKEGGMHLEADDRRHYVAWSDLTKADFTADYWRDLHQWFDAGGADDCAAYLREVDVSAFDAKSPPPLTDAFWAMVEANRPESTYDLAELVSRIGDPDALTMAHLVAAAHGNDEMVKWLKAPGERKKVSRGLADIGYEVVRNPDDKTGRWQKGDQRFTVYAKKKVDRTRAIKILLEAPTIH
jgi:hypothetical protein